LEEKRYLSNLHSMEMPNDLEAIHLYPESRLEDIKSSVESMPPCDVANKAFVDAGGITEVQSASEAKKLLNTPAAVLPAVGMPDTGRVVDDRYRTPAPHPASW